jgi:hypothetical protein
MTYELQDRTPEEIQSQIAETRASLDRKLQELEHRLSPRERLQRVAAHLHPEQFAPWAAVGAIATGTYLAVRGWRRYHPAHQEQDLLSTTFVVCEGDELQGGI